MEASSSGSENEDEDDRSNEETSFEPSNSKAEQYQQSSTSFESLDKSNVIHNQTATVNNNGDSTIASISQPQTKANKRLNLDSQQPSTSTGMKVGGSSEQPRATSSKDDILALFTSSSSTSTTDTTTIISPLSSKSSGQLTQLCEYPIKNHL